MSNPSHPSRRAVLHGGLATLAALVAPTGCAPEPASEIAGPRVIPAWPPLRSLIDQIGPLGEPNDLGARLPPGFSIRVVARTGEPALPGADYDWHLLPDGGACYATEDGGWIYVSNSEIPLAGGVGALRFDAQGVLVATYPILAETNLNCAGGKTPWHTWLSCEEIGRGRVFECDPWGEEEPVDRPALGRFKHEAAAVDEVHAHVYLTEDESDGRLYRFVPHALTADGHPDLTGGRLQVAVVEPDVQGSLEGVVRWVDVPDPLAQDTPTRHQVAESTVFRGGEGIWWHAGFIYFATKGDDRVWALDTRSGQLTILYQPSDHDPDDLPLVGVDNLTVSCCGDVLVAEDLGKMRIVAILPSGELKPLVQLVGQDTSEITGPAFDPSGTRLYFSSQRAEGMMGGITYEMTGPFHEIA